MSQQAFTNEQQYQRQLDNQQRYIDMKRNVQYNHGDHKNKSLQSS